MGGGSFTLLQADRAGRHTADRQAPQHGAPSQCAGPSLHTHRHMPRGMGLTLTQPRGHSLPARLRLGAVVCTWTTCHQCSALAQSPLSIHI